MSPHIIGVLLAIMASVFYGSGDFIGGFVTRKINHFQALILTSLAGIGVMLVLALVWGDSIPAPRDALWAVLAGVSGALGVAWLYRGLSLGHAAVVSPVAGVIGAVVPVIYGMFVEGMPNPTQFAGFGFALVGIWFASRVPSAEAAVYREGLTLAVLAGLGFSGFFIFIAQVQVGEVFAPLLISRLAAISVGLIAVFASGLKLPSVKANPLGLAAGVLDSGANVLFLLARQYTRVDVAAVLASLYPAVTVLLARMVLKERIAPPQRLGAVLCLVAIALIAI